MDGVRDEVALLQLSMSRVSVLPAAVAESPPCPAQRVFTAQGSLNYNLDKKVSLLQQTATISEGSFQSVGVSLSSTVELAVCPAQQQLPAEDWQSPSARRDGVTRATLTAVKLGLAMRSHPNLFFG